MATSRRCSFVRITAAESINISIIEVNIWGTSAALRNNSNAKFVENCLLGLIKENPTWLLYIKSLYRLLLFFHLELEMFWKISAISFIKIWSVLFYWINFVFKIYRFVCEYFIWNLVEWKCVTLISPFVRKCIISELRVILSLP